jgi:branched-chain amino acid transport system substrate-binding protein
MGHDASDGRYDRRDFLRRASVSAGALTAVPALLSACGSEDSGGGGGSGDAIKIGYITPATGALAPFAEADDFILTGVREAFGEGIQTRDGSRQVEIIVKDSQSNPDRAGSAASDLILKDKVDLVVVASTPETVNPVSDQCELNGVPCISSVAPWQAWFIGRGGEPQPGGKDFNFTYHFFWGADDLVNVYMDMWGQVRTNKNVGLLMPNDSDGNALADKATGFPAALRKGGFSVTDPGRYENGTNDFSAQINRFRSGNNDILTGVPIPPDFTTFWKAASQQGYRPPVATIAKAVLFPSAVQALGASGDGVSTEVWWSPQHPFSSSLTDTSAEQLAAAYTEETDRPWTQPIGFVHALFEVVNDVLTKASNPKDKQAVADQIAKTKLDTIVGTVDWTNGPVKNVAKTPLTGGQWRRSGGDFELVIVSNSIADQIPRADRLQTIS